MANIRSHKARKIKCQLIDRGVDFYCAYCGRSGLKPFRSTKDGEIEESDVVSFDHFIPSSKGGSDEISNLVLSCKSCNQAKKDDLIEKIVLTVENLMNLPPKEPKEEHKKHPTYIHQKNKSEKKKKESEKRYLKIMLELAEMTV